MRRKKLLQSGKNSLLNKLIRSYWIDQLIDSYLEEKNLKDKIKSEKTEYSAKKGLFYKEVTFKDEPGVTYVVQPISTNKGLFVEGFDTETKKSLKTAKHKYFNQNYKPSK